MLTELSAAGKIGTIKAVEPQRQARTVREALIESALPKNRRIPGKGGWYFMNEINQYRFIKLRERPELEDSAAEWFHEKWGVPKEAYLECMEQYLSRETEYGWYLCLDGEKIVGGLGVIENDFHNRKDLAPNVCAVFTEEEYRCRGISGTLLNLAVEDMRSKGITPIYLVTDHVGFYERYGWEFLCMAQGDGEPEMTRLYVHY